MGVDPFVIAGPLDAVLACGRVLGYRPEPGRLVVHAVDGDRVVFTASVETDPAGFAVDGGVGLVGDVGVLVPAVRGNGASSVVVVLFTDSGRSHVPAGVVAGLFEAAGVGVRVVVLVDPEGFACVWEPGLADGGVWVRVPVDPDAPTWGRGELLPAPAAALDVGVIEEEWVLSRSRDVGVRVGVGLSLLDVDCVVSEAAVAVLGEVRVRDWVLRELARMAGSGGPGGAARLGRVGERLLSVALSAPQPWASTVGVVAAVAYYLSGNAGVQLQAALEVGLEGDSRGLADLIGRVVFAGLPPSVWIEGALELTDEAILAASGSRAGGGDLRP